MDMDEIPGWADELTGMSDDVRASLDLDAFLDRHSLDVSFRPRLERLMQANGVEEFEDDPHGIPLSKHIKDTFHLLQQLSIGFSTSNSVRYHFQGRFRSFLA